MGSGPFYIGYYNAVYFRGLLDNIRAEVPPSLIYTETQLRAFLGMMGLSGEKVHQQSGTLSGGEKTKLALAMMFDALKMRPLSEDARAATQAELERPLGALEQHLQDRDYLLGDHFTVADLNVASVMAWARWGKVDMSKFPKAADWLKRCMGRPAFKG